MGEQSVIAEILRGVSLCSDLGIALFFYRYWFHKRDNLFLFFSGAFILMAVSTCAVVFLGGAGEFAPFSYGLRVAAFSLIICGIAIKNQDRKD